MCNLNFVLKTFRPLPRGLHQLLMNYDLDDLQKLNNIYNNKQIVQTRKNRPEMSNVKFLKARREQG